MTPSNEQNKNVMIGAVIWAIAAAIIGAFFIFGTPDLEYGGAAYSGIQQAAAQTARGVGWLIVSTGVLGLIVAAKGTSP